MGQDWGTLPWPELWMERSRHILVTKEKKKCDIEGPHYLKKLGIRGGRGQNVNPFKRWGGKINVGDFIFKKKLQIIELFV